MTDDQSTNPDASSDDTSDATSDTTPGTTAETSSDTASEATSDAKAETTSDTGSESSSDAQPAQLPVNPGHVRDVTLIELQRVTDLVHGLTLEQWKQPSAAKGWNIGDVVAHLDLALGLYNRLLGAVVGGSGSGPLFKAFGKFSEMVAPVAGPAFNAVNAAIPRLIESTMEPEVVKGRFAASSRKLKARLETVGGADYTRPVYYVGGPYPLSFFMSLMINEVAIHGWDIESRLTMDAHLDEPAGSVLPWFYWSATALMLKPPRGTEGKIQVTLQDPAASMWWNLTEVTNGRGTVENPDVEISGPASPFVLALAGRIPAADVLDKTLLEVQGDELLGKTFLGSWNLI
jgi:uncharacterized protein (TIGR03083 family)